MKPLSWQQRLRAVLRLLAGEWRTLGDLFALMRDDIPLQSAMAHARRRLRKEWISESEARWQLFVDTLRRWGVESKATRERTRANDFTQHDTLVRLRARDILSTSHEAVSVSPTPCVDLSTPTVAVRRWAAGLVDTLCAEVPARQVRTVLAFALKLAARSAPKLEDDSSLQ
jgi:hypothetical protein